jgi:CSLREA domain-containing protein
MAKNPFGFRASILLLGLGGQAAFAASITVNTATDDFGSVPGNCSLREAIQSANDNVDFGGCDSTGVYGAAITDVITLPSLGAGGAFLLSRVGTDDTNAAGDLDIDGNTRIDGVSATNSLIRGDTGDPDIDRHRLVHVIGGTVVLNDLTRWTGGQSGSRWRPAHRARHRDRAQPSCRCGQHRRRQCRRNPQPRHDDDQCVDCRRQRGA